eukprot:GHVS01041116.1.p2 GENE.GHVS01041116.1~~GHVS01041116.1.p2  ORF type:complete len:267 (-),score=53.80 GHVS01041116.1:2026-2826(-)
MKLGWRVITSFIPLLLSQQLTSSSSSIRPTTDLSTDNLSRFNSSVPIERPTAPSEWSPPKLLQADDEEEEEELSVMVECAVKRAEAATEAVSRTVATGFLYLSVPAPLNLLASTLFGIPIDLLLSPVYLTLLPFALVPWNPYILFLLLPFLLPIALVEVDDPNLLPSSAHEVEDYLLKGLSPSQRRQFRGLLHSACKTSPSEDLREEDRDAGRFEKELKRFSESIDGRMFVSQWYHDMSTEDINEELNRYISLARSIAEKQPGLND